MFLVLNQQRELPGWNNHTWAAAHGLWQEVSAETCCISVEVISATAWRGWQKRFCRATITALTYQSSYFKSLKQEDPISERTIEATTLWTWYIIFLRPVCYCFSRHAALLRQSETYSTTAASLQRQRFFAWWWASGHCQPLLPRVR